MESKGIILFDGTCNLCNRCVQFIIHHDRDDIFRFETLQSENGRKITSHFYRPHEYNDSIRLIINGRYFQKSRAVIEIGTRLNGMIRIIWLLRIFPHPVLDFFYDLIARSRHNIFGQSGSCGIPKARMMEI
jgi:predicted DCC family thiol-disulfide oxidoreductase YuxK